MVMSTIYVGKISSEVISEKEKQDIIYEHTFVLFRNKELFNDFLNEKINNSKMNCVDTKKMKDIKKDFLEECHNMAEKVFDEFYVRRIL